MKKIDFKKIKAAIPAVTTALKYLFALILTVLASVTLKNPRYFIAGLYELLIIFLFSNLLMKKKLPGQIVNDLLLLLYNAQMIVAFFANSFITMLMLTNLDSVEDLSGKALVYGTGIVLVLVFSFFPIRRCSPFGCSGKTLLSAVLCLELAFTLVCGNCYSPIYSYFDLAIQQHQNRELARSIQEAVSAATASSAEEAEQSAKTPVCTSAVPTLEPEFFEGSETESGIIKLTVPSAAANPSLSFYSDEIVDCRPKDNQLAVQPNIILIFTEGLSRNIITDPRDLMPNAAEYQEKSLSFSGYYNHTFATFRGLIGQLYSGYQLDNYDSNALVSLQGILSDQGYHTALINTEPNNTDFTPYLERLGFQEIIGDPSSECRGMANSISDRDAYTLLYDSAVEFSKTDSPFFLAIYTFGTHASLDSVDKKFGDGTDSELNKFFNADAQFGYFMEKFERSILSENTIVIFTADHATYQDDSFNRAFPDYTRTTTSCDEIPLFFYYRGITPEQVEVNGRNTLDLAPTILDYLDLSVPNHFLGSSLFADSASRICETCYSDSYVLYSTKNAQIGSLEGSDAEEFNEILQEYYIAKELAAAGTTED